MSSGISFTHSAPAIPARSFSYTLKSIRLLAGLWNGGAGELANELSNVRNSRLRSDFDLEWYTLGVNVHSLMLCYTTFSFSLDLASFMAYICLYNRSWTLLLFCSCRTCEESSVRWLADLTGRELVWVATAKLHWLIRRLQCLTNRLLRCVSRRVV
jgi:hypothetical protein